MAGGSGTKNAVIGCLIAIAIIVLILFGWIFLNYHLAQNDLFGRAAAGRTAAQTETEIEKLLSGKSCEQRKNYLIAKSFKKISTSEVNTYNKNPKIGQQYQYVVYDRLFFILIPSTRIQFSIDDTGSCIHKVYMEGI